MAPRQLDPRKMMKKAIEVMRESVVEGRKDGKKNPAVGSVLVKANGTSESACRGELRDGDHAEFTLLERKNRGKALDGCVLFTTLEPCAPGARTHPKLSCAERIVLARIKRVWVGIEDPDPTVDRKGIKYLQDHAVSIEMFDRDLQDEITAFNTEFIDQAEARAAARDQPPEPVTLSTLEHRVPTADLKDFSDSALDEYRRALSPSEDMSSQALERRLLQSGLVQSDGENWFRRVSECCFSAKHRVR